MRGYLPFLIILFLLAAFFQVEFFFKVVYLIAAIYLLSRFWLERVIEGMEISRTFDDHAFPGDEILVTLHFTNTSWLPVPGLELHEATPVLLVSPPFPPQAVTLSGHETKTFSYPLVCRRRGYFPLGPLAVQLNDLLGLVKPGLLRLERQPFTIYPKVVPLQQLGLPTRAPLAALPTLSPLFEDPARVVGVRSYQPGDSPRRVHWTASARAGELLVKQFKPTIARETMICLNLNPEDYQVRYRYHVTELAITVAASITSHIINRDGLPVGLITEAHDPLAEVVTRFYRPARAEQAHLVGMLEVLARVQITSEINFLDLLQHVKAHLPWGATIVVITGNKTEALLKTLIYLRKSGFAISLVVVREASLKTGFPIPKGIQAYQVWQEEDIEVLA